MDQIASRFPDPASHPALYLALPALLIVAILLARRVPIIRSLLSIAIWIVLIALAIMLFTDRARFDPYLTHVAQSLNLDGQQVTGKEVRIRMSPDGHFWAHVRIGGVERQMLVDSGATVTALSSDTAAAAGLRVHDPLFPMVLNTANGRISAQTADVATLRLGAIRANDLAVVVSPAFGDTDVLGMNFLSRLKSWRVEDGTLVLVPHHPQPVKDAAG
jgi:aspartyl protease family protein